MLTHHVVCCESQRDAEEFLKEVRERFLNFGLELSPKKTKMIKFGRNGWRRWRQGGAKVETFNFLGFTHYCETSRKGYFKMVHKTTKRNLSDKLKEINEWLKKIRNLVPLKLWWPELKAKLVGHYSYFGISGNYRCLNQFYWRVIRMVYKWINRRSQRKSMNWEIFLQYSQWNPLPTPRIYHALYD